MAARKTTKEGANYRQGTPTRKCALCTMFRPPHGCTAVLGTIRPQDVCDFFRRKK